MDLELDKVRLDAIHEITSYQKESLTDAIGS